MGSETSLAPILVAVPSVGRPESLSRCLRAIAAQDYSGPLVAAVVARPDDLETRAVAASHNVSIIDAVGRGVAGAYESAIEAAQKSQIVIFTDDDAAPHANWASLIANRFAEDSALGAIGGRDIVQNDMGPRPKHLAHLGKVTLLHGVVGHHEWGGGEFREIDHLKGVNMAFRAESVAGSRLGELTEGEGAQFRSEFILSMIVTSRGWTIKYDPEILVDHFHAARASGDERKNFSTQRIYLNMRNLFFGLSAFGKTRLLTKSIAYAVLRGDRRHPGLLLIPPLVLSERTMRPLERFSITLAGIRTGISAGQAYRKRPVGSL